MDAAMKSSGMPPTRFKATVHRVLEIAKGIRSYELTPCEVDTFPAATAGAHIDLHLTPTLTRSYSLCGRPGETLAYQVAVALDPHGSGGSRYLFDEVVPGRLLEISTTTNHFSFCDDAPFSVFVAGGIGITPLWSMIQGLKGRSARWILYYAARSKIHAAFLDEIESFAQEHGGTMVLSFGDDPARERWDFQQVVDRAPLAAHFYCCGPKRMIDAFVASTSALPPERVHVEYFEGIADKGGDKAFTVELAKSGKCLIVLPGETILEVVEAAGICVAHSCREGVCGACEVRVLSGTPDHKDLVLSVEEKAKNQSMMICCSGSASHHLVLDL
ncbi:PDR/VanB family oxidoreductase [Hydrogenophaga sp. PBL-H3]|uniref:PDR/VanB family oxidoreductase n=1 Tax=Hydrogenophaga sp. PBL-H3 TaxID=434010 RepID=UPI00131F75D4|nr:PDR/VanB family oxidoreductase [Hydrogenophaga sp. PBL-H3]QHE74888.1 oxidoreductase [Hydrogenophaga sp. PBL-H3]QHE79315.1 oxidoreductase [Hydrogenophaga sp. PBL-H3]